MGRNSNALLDLEGKNSSLSSIESTLLVCKKNDLLHSQTTKPRPPDGKTVTSSVPKSQVLGRVKDFLGVMSEANKRLQLDAKENSKDYDIEMLTGNESEYIEMDLMLGVADLHTPEAVAAAESAIVGHQPVIPLAASCYETGSEDSSDTDDDNDKNDTLSPRKFETSKPAEDNSTNKALRNGRSKKRQKIVELL